jgi:tRNA pseudouridine38-40 synthase
MNYYKLTISYKGTNYCGWQIQSQGERTIQGELNSVLNKILKEEVKTIGSGRTDSGVHALNQVVKVSTSKNIECINLKNALNSLLPNDISVNKVESTTKEFRPTNDAKVKEYHYYFSNNKHVHPLVFDLIANISFDLNFSQMAEACECFLGVHDFSDFQCVGTDVQSTTREIFECKLEKVQSLLNICEVENCYVLKVRGSGFLKQMVRLMMGTIWQIGRAKTPLEELKLSMNDPLGKKLGPVAAPEGLYLALAEY